MTYSITQHQRKAFDFIASFIAEKGYGPTFDEISEALGMNSRGRAHFVVSELISRGLLVKMPRKRRCIALASSKPSLDWLIPSIRDRLLAHCAKHGDDVTAVMIDAIVLHLDSFEPATVGRSEARAQ